MKNSHKKPRLSTSLEPSKSTVVSPVLFKEQRKHPREPANFMLKMADGGNPQRATTALVVDISEGGAAIETNKKMEHGSSLTLKLPLPYIIQGDVVRCQVVGTKFRYGIRFHHIRHIPQGMQLARSRTSVRMAAVQRAAIS